MRKRMELRGERGRRGNRSCWLIRGNVGEGIRLGGR
jgi:hypothetical protein